MATKNKIAENQYGEPALSAQQANNISNQVDQYNNALAQSKQFKTKEELEATLIDKPYRYLDNLSPFVSITVLVPVRDIPEDDITWVRYPIPPNVINIKELEIIDSGAQVKITTFDPDYVFLEELALKVTSYNQRGYKIQLEVEYGWAAPDSLKRANPKVEFTDIIKVSNPHIDTRDTKNGLIGEISGAIDLIPPIANNYSPAAALGIGSVANYFLIYDFLCLDFDDKMDLIWSVKDPKQKSKFILEVLDFFEGLSEASKTDKKSVNISGFVNKSTKVDQRASVVDAITKSKDLRTAKGKNYNLLKAEFAKLEKNKFPSGPYSILKYIRDTKGVNKRFEKFFELIDIVFENYRIHPYRIYKFLVEVFEKDVLNQKEVKKTEAIEFFDIDITDLSKMGGNLKGINSPDIKKNVGSEEYIKIINALHSGDYPGDIGKDYRELIRLSYKRFKDKKGKPNKDYSDYFFPKKDYSLSTDMSFEQLIPGVASKCRHVDDIVKGKKQEASYYTCQFFKASLLSAFNNLNVLELILKSQSKERQKTEFFKRTINKIAKTRDKVITKLKLGDKDINNSNIIFCLFVPNAATAILKNENELANNILTSYSYRMRTLKNENYFNAGTKKFTSVNLPDVLSIEFSTKDDKAGSSVSRLVPFITAGSDYKLIQSLTDNQKKSIDTIYTAASEVVELKMGIDKLELEIRDQSKIPTKDVTKLKQEIEESKKKYFRLMYGNTSSANNRLTEIANQASGAINNKSIDPTSDITTGGLLKNLNLFLLKLQEGEQGKIIKNLTQGSAFKNIIESLASSNSISLKIEEKSKELKKLKKADKEQKISDLKYEFAQGDFNKIQEFVDKYKEITNNTLLDVKFNLNFDDPTIFGAGSSSSAVGLASQKSMENLRRRKAMESNSIEATVTVLGNPALKKMYVQGPSNIFLNVYNPDGSLSEYAGQYSLGALESQKVSAGVYITVLKLLKTPANNGIILDYLQNNDIIPLC